MYQDFPKIIECVHILHVPRVPPMQCYYITQHLKEAIYNAIFYINL